MAVDGRKLAVAGVFLSYTGLLPRACQAFSSSSTSGTNNLYDPANMEALMTAPTYWHA